MFTEKAKMKMIKNIKNFIFQVIVLVALTFISVGVYAKGSVKPIKINDKTRKRILKNAQNLNPTALKLGIRAYDNARKDGLDKEGMLTIIDYSLPSSARRLWVINLNNGNVPFNIHVANGHGGEKHFSNQPSSLASSIGVYETGNTYIGKHGYSMRLIGLDKGFNDKVYTRTVVMHAAWYVSKSFLAKYGRLGRSWGCPAISKKAQKPVISKIKNGTIMLAYYPNKEWMEDSKYLQA
jgi:hypothetical protein